LRRVFWSRRALDEFDEAIGYIAQDSRRAALDVAVRLNDSAERLGEFATGRRGEQAGAYEKVVARTSYVLVYAIDESRNAIVILRVIHMARDRAEE